MNQRWYRENFALCQILTEGFLLTIPAGSIQKQSAWDQTLEVNLNANY